MNEMRTDQIDVVPCYQIAAVVDGLLCGLVGKIVARMEENSGGYRVKVATVDYNSSGGGGYENLRGASPVDGVKTMVMPQRDGPPSRCALRRTSTIEAIKRIDASVEYAVMHGDEEEAERIREELRRLTDEV